MMNAAAIAALAPLGSSLFDVQEQQKSWADPPRISPCAPLACKVRKVCGIFVANCADYAGFADLSGL
jgi:hypothetical protein